MNVFVYGTLMDPGLVRSLTGKTFATCRARLNGFRRLQPPGSYPFIVREDDDCVDGLMLLGVDADALHALDAYEGEGHLYLRTDVIAETDDGRCSCATYVGNPEALDALRVT